MTIPFTNSKYLDLGPAKAFQPSPEDTPGNQIKILAGNLLEAETGQIIITADQLSLAFSNVTTTNRVRWDLVVINKAGAPVIIQGEEQSIPVADFTGLRRVPLDEGFPVAIVKIDESASVVVSASDIVDIRPRGAFNKTFKQFDARPQEPIANDSIFVYGGSVGITQGQESFTLADNFASAITFPVVTSDSRIDLLALNITGASPVVERISGVQSASPVAPTVNLTTHIPICYVTVNETSGVIIEANDIVDARQTLNTIFTTKDRVDALAGPAIPHLPSAGNTFDTVSSVDEKIAEAFAIPVGFIGGLNTSNSGVDSDHDITIQSGQAKSDDNLEDMTLSTSITKQIDAIFAEGNNLGGLDSGSVTNNVLYAVWLIKRTDTGIVDVLFSTSFTSPSLPANYDKKRLIAAVYTDASANIVEYTQVDDYFQYRDLILEFSTTGQSANTYFTETISACPRNCIAQFFMKKSSGLQSNNNFHLKTKGGTQVLSADDTFAWIHVGSGDSSSVTRECKILIDNNQEIEYGHTQGSGSYECNSLGFIMLTRRNPNV